LVVSNVYDNDGSLAHEEYQSTVVAQLRYEYALNLLHRIGAHLSRVGVDFVPMRH